MDFFKFIKSLDELLYEVISWLLFYPLTLWRMIHSPVRTMLAAQRELREDESGQFDDSIAPPLFLLLTLILLHVVELGVVGQSELVRSNVGLRGLIQDDTSLIIFRILMYSLLPVAAAARLLQARGAHFDKKGLRSPFYGQCYAGGVFALLLNTAGLLLGRPGLQAELAAVVLILALGWLLVVEARWFSAELNVGLLRGLGQALLMTGQWALIVLLVALAMR